MKIVNLPRVVIFLFFCLFGAVQAQSLREEHLVSTEQNINQAIIHQDWTELERLLLEYRQYSGYDIVLWQYGSGALAYQRKEYSKAIRLYRDMIATNPELVYARFDLAIMLFENKQLVAAEQQFRKVKAVANKTGLLKLTNEYLSAIQKANAWQFDFSANYSVNDNVNNAASSRTIKLNDTVFTRTDDSLPKKSSGISYAFDASKDWNISGRHYLSSTFRVAGDYYWDAEDYQLTQARFDIGYRYKLINSEVSLRPFISTVWLGGDYYSNTIGVNTSASRWLGNHWRVATEVEISRQRYINNDYHRYDNQALNLLSSVTYFPSAKQYLQLGLGSGYQNADDSSESQVTTAIQLRWGYEWDYGISSRLNIAMERKRYKNNHYLYLYKRKDISQQFDLTLWKRNWHYWGLTPKITYSYKKNNSNIPDLYQREQSKLFISAEKSF